MVFIGCAKKPKSIIPSDLEVQEVKVDKLVKLNLPVVKNVNLKKTEDKIYINWDPIPSSSLPKNEFSDIKLFGYNVYKFSKNGFIPKKPINLFPIKDCLFTENNSCKNHDKFYLVRAIFEYRGNLFEGVSSKLISII